MIGGKLDMIILYILGFGVAYALLASATAWQQMRRRGDASRKAKRAHLFRLVSHLLIVAWYMCVGLLLTIGLTPTQEEVTSPVIVAIVVIGSIGGVLFMPAGLYAARHSAQLKDQDSLSRLQSLIEPPLDETTHT